MMHINCNKNIELWSMKKSYYIYSINVRWIYICQRNIEIIHAVMSIFLNVFQFCPLQISSGSEVSPLHTMKTSPLHLHYNTQCLWPNVRRLSTNCVIWLQWGVRSSTDSKNVLRKYSSIDSKNKTPNNPTPKWIVLHTGNKLIGFYVRNTNKLKYVVKTH